MAVQIYPKHSELAVHKWSEPLAFSLMNLLIISKQYNQLFIQSHSDHATGQHVIKTAQLS